MASIKLRVIVNELSNVLTQFDQIKVYRSTTGESGPFVEITGVGTRVDLVAGTTLYEYIDSSGDPSYWYRFAYFNSATSAEGTASDPIQGEGVEGRYCTIQDIRDEGISSSDYDDARVSTAIALASQYIEMFTGRWFEPRSLDFHVDGTGKRSIHLDQPIIELTSLYLDDDVEYDLVDDIAVYNRHISENLVQPDDRENPRVEMIYPLESSVYYRAAGLRVFPEGQKNIRFVGTFGYTDYDGTGSGKTPDMIRHVCKLLTLRELEPKGNALTGGGLPASQAYRITELRTRDQSIRYGAVSKNTLGRAGVGLFTGDPQIDQILLRYRRTPKLRSV
jgi:hypothetical protein